MSTEAGGFDLNEQELKTNLKTVSASFSNLFNTMGPVFAAALSDELNEQAKRLLGPQLTWKLFADQAYIFMRQRRIPVTQEGLFEFSNVLLTKFKNDLEQGTVFEYDPATGELVINSEMTMKLEYGDLYRPALQLYSKAIAEAAVSLALSKKQAN